MPSFREAVLASSGWRDSSGVWTGWGGHSGSSPTPFDAVDGKRLAGPHMSHPLALVTIDDLVQRSSGGLDGAIDVDYSKPVVIGGGIDARLWYTPRRNINARNAAIRLLGCRLAEEQRSAQQGENSRVEWVEAHGKLFVEEVYLDSPLPTTLVQGQRYETQFTIPAPRLGPVSAHMGSAILAWAIEARWDISMGGDERIATPVQVGQNIDYLRSGAVRLENGAMFDIFGDGDGTIAVRPLPPLAVGAQFEAMVNWPSAGSGRGGRFELQANVNAPNPLKGVVLATISVDPATFRGGASFPVQIPPDAPPTLADQGLAVNYRLRALVDRPFRSDLAIERAIAVM